MISMKLWKVIFCITIQCVAIISVSTNQQNKRYCVCELLNKLTEVSKAPIHNSHNLYIKHNDLKCGFIYSAHFHMYWTRDLYSDTKSKLIKRFRTNEISFVDESMKMINILFYKKGIQMNEIWLVYWYAEKMNSFYNDFSNKKIETNDDKMIKNMEMHDFIFAELENYLKANCGGKYYFDPNSEYCVYYKKVVIVPSYINNIITRIESKNKSGEYQTTDFVSTQNAIKVNKTMLHTLFGEYNLDNYAMIYGTPFYTLSQLFFNNLFNQSLLDSFWGKYLKSDISDVVSSDTKDYVSKTIGNGLSGIIYTGMYQRMVTDVLKLIMLQKIGSYLIIIGTLTRSEFKAHVSRIEKFAAVLSDFIEAMSLEDDPFFAMLKNYIHFNYLKYSSHHSKIFIIIVKIKLEIEVLSKTWKYLSDSFSIIDFSFKSDLLKEIVDSTEKFVDKLINTFGTYFTFRYIQSFSKTVNDITNKISLSKMCKKRDNYIVKLKFYQF